MSNEDEKIKQFVTDLSAVIERNQTDSMRVIRAMGGTFLGAGIGALVASGATGEEVAAMFEALYQKAKETAK
jgi:hypothetical protein